MKSRKGRIRWRSEPTLIEQAIEDETLFAGEVEVDESYFGGVRKSKRGSGAAGQVPVLRLLKRGRQVYSKIIPDTKGPTLKTIIEQRVVPDSIGYSDPYRSYNALDVSAFKHFRIIHSERFADHPTHFNGIENVWNQAKGPMRRFNGIPKSHFPLFLKECEWPFNNPSSRTQLQQ